MKTSTRLTSLLCSHTGNIGNIGNMAKFFQPLASSPAVSALRVFSNSYCNSPQMRGGRVGSIGSIGSIGGVGSIGSVGSVGSVGRRCVSAKNTTVDEKEVEKFSKMADQWWDLHGDFAPLHALNPVRIQFIKQHIQTQYQLQRGVEEGATTGVLHGLRTLDVGCGGGLVSEALCRLGGNVTGVDASPVNIEIANAHKDDNEAELFKHGGSLSYEHVTAEELVERGEKFDCVVALEIVEHVSDPKVFIDLVISLVKPGGCLFVSTMSRSAMSLLQTIVAAEYILRLIPPGTHEFNKYINPQELKDMIVDGGAVVKDVAGMVYNPLADHWSLDPSNVNVNYIMFARRAT